MSLSPYLQTVTDAAWMRATSVRPVKPITLTDSFLQQWAWITTKSRFNCVLCSRRAGKTRGAVRRAAMKLMQGKKVFYINATALNAQIQFFEPLKELLDSKDVSYRPDNANLLIRTPNGGLLRCVGCDNIAEVRKKLGDGWDEVFVDEMQDIPEAVLWRLIDKAISPMLIDRSGSLHCMGTPPLTMAGFWYEMWARSTPTETKDAYTRFGWTLMDNPYIEKDWFAPYRVRGLKEDDPIVLRECKGMVVTDPNLSVFCYSEARNAIVGGELLNFNDPNWRFTIGVDLGFSDSDAIVVLGWRVNDGDRRLYEVYSWQENHLDYVKLAEKYKSVLEQFPPSEVCIDTGGHGARKIMESLKTLFPSYQYRLKPASVPDSIALVNDDLRTGRAKVKPGGLVAHDMGLCVWKEGKVGVEMSDSFHSDVMAAYRYAHSCAYHYLSEAPKAQTQEEEDEERRINAYLRQRQLLKDPMNPYV